MNHCEINTIKYYSNQLYCIPANYPKVPAKKKWSDLKNTNSFWPLDYFSNGNPEHNQSSSWTPYTYRNKVGLATVNDVVKIDSFLLMLRYFGFDLWISRYVETGKAYFKRNLFSKFVFLVTIMLINCQMFIHLAAILHIILTKKKNFFNFLDDLRTFILKLTMTIAVDLWFLKFVLSILLFLLDFKRFLSF